MSQKQIETVLNDLPRSEEAKDRVIEWLRGYQTESESREGSGEESEEDSQPDHPTNTKERLGAIIQRGDPTDSQNGSTASKADPAGKGRQPPKADPCIMDRQPPKADPGKDR